MLISLIIAFFLLHGGSAAFYAQQLDQLDTRIKKEITVDSTKKQALAIVAGAQAANKAFVDERKKYVQALGGVLGDRASTAAQINAVALPLLAGDSATTEKMVDMYVKLRPVIGAGDWPKVFPTPTPKPMK